ncbi:periplasmic heavy metal sensor [Ruegeria sediminis]|uniref:Periplasmic heavy metal sensor n=1 Tax=Ruegeria sediminis TaxID=2583820 RepID=A0ABY2WZI6_9RHOB|nr:periplasmic heavy metal sensor [Ruegeria sediminis]TMV08011.1 periplasmic heavy metal sensor [Ruegeria sediminis]
MSEEKPKTRRWLPILLGLSLALNLLVVGVVLGTAMRFRGGEGMRHAPSFGPVLYRALPEEDRKALRGQLRRDHEASSHERREDFEALADALRAVPFDPDAVQVLIGAQAAHRAETHMALNRAWLERVSAMSDAQRAAYAERVEEAVERGKRYKGYKRDRD